MVTLPGCSIRSAWEARQAEVRARQEREARATAARLAAEKAKAASAEAARAFPQRRDAIEEQLTALDTATKSKDWTNARQRAQALQTDLAPLFASEIGASPDVAAIKSRLDAQQKTIATQIKEQQAADTKRKADEAARAQAAAETARRAAWKPEPIMMSIHCARYAKEGLLDAEAKFVVETLSVSGRTYAMQGQVIGHNAFNARIAKRAVCKVYMDMKTGTETYSTTIVD
jgi:hypothetical protein